MTVGPATDKNKIFMNLSAANDTGVLEPAWVTYELGLTIWFTFMLVCILLGTISNGLLLFAILSCRKLLHGSGILIAHSLALNLMLCAVHMPMVAVSTFLGKYYQYSSPSFCQYQVLFYYTCVYSVNYASLGVAVNRFVAVFFPHKYNKWAEPKVTLFMALVSWMVPFACNLTIFYGNGGSFESVKPWGACGIAPTQSLVYPVTMVLCVPVPMITLSTLYMLIFAVYWWRSFVFRLSGGKAADTNASISMDRRLKRVKLLFLSALWYAIALIPAPTAGSLYPVEYVSFPLLQLLFRGLLMLAYSTTPVRSTQELLVTSQTHFENDLCFSRPGEPLT